MIFFLILRYKLWILFLTRISPGKRWQPPRSVKLNTNILRLGPCQQHSWQHTGSILKLSEHTWLFLFWLSSTAFFQTWHNRRRSWQFLEHCMRQTAGEEKPILTTLPKQRAARDAMSACGSLTRNKPSRAVSVVTPNTYAKFLKVKLSKRSHCKNAHHASTTCQWCKDHLRQQLPFSLRSTKQLHWRLYISPRAAQSS